MDNSKPAGCYYYGGDTSSHIGIWYNTNTNGSSTETIRWGICRWTSDANTCMTDVCSRDSDCTATPTPGENSTDFYCEFGQCHTLLCETNSDCPSTNYCHSEDGICSFCYDDSQCASDIVCGSDQTCQIECTTEDESSTCSQTNLAEHCFDGQCTTEKPCTEHSECSRTDFCNPDTRACSICDENSTCDTGSSCQALTYYFSPWGSGCESVDQIRDQTICESIATIENESYQTANTFLRPYGCNDNSNKFKFNLTEGTHNGDSYIRSVCRQTSTDNFTCLADECNIDSECTSDEHTSEQNTVDFYCQYGQCRTKTCSDSSECATTNYCHVETGLCSFCDDSQSTDQCEYGFTCKSDGICLEDVCTTENEGSTCSQSDLSEHCVEGQCSGEKSCSTNSDCSRTEFCDEQTRICALCDANSTCDTGSSCQYLTYYFSPGGSGCESVDQITDQIICETLADEYNVECLEVTNNYRPYGCNQNMNSNSGKFKFNLANGTHNGDSYMRSICKNTQTDNFTCLTDSCQSDSNCQNENHTSGQNTVDLYCIFGQCRSQLCLTNSDCPATNYCYSTSGLCSFCDDSQSTDQCETGYSCQSDGICLQDICSTENEGSICSQSDLTEHCVSGQCSQSKECVDQSECSRTNFCNQDTNTCDLCDGAEKLCEEGWTCQTEAPYNSFQCLLDICQADQDCLESNLYCIQGQCLQKLCDLSSDCEKTNYCDYNSGFCADCDGITEICDDGFTCSADSFCIESEEEGCNVNDHLTCTQGAFWYCEQGECVERDCFDESVDCSKLYPPSWLFEQNEITILYETEWSIDILDYLGEDPNGDSIDTYEITVNLSQGSAFLTYDDTTLSSIQFDSEESLNLAQTQVSQTSVSIEIKNQYHDSAVAIIQFYFVTENSEETSVETQDENLEENQDEADSTQTVEVEIATTDDILDWLLDSDISLDDSTLEQLLDLADLNNDSLIDFGEFFYLQSQEELLEVLSGCGRRLKEEEEDTQSDCVSFIQQLQEQLEQITEQTESTTSDGGDTGIVVEIEQDQEVAAPLKRTVKVSERGLVTIKFSKEMNFPDNLVELIQNGKKNKRFLSQEIIALNVLEGDFQVSKNLEHDWKVLCVEKTVQIAQQDQTTCVLPSQKKIQIQVDFKNALEISQGESPDVVQIQFKENSLFQDPDQTSRNEIVFDLEYELPSQIPLICQSCDMMNSAAESTQATITYVVTTSFVVSMLIGMSKNVIFSLIGMMQMYIYLPLLDIKFPGNIRIFLSFFMEMASCDLFTDEEIYRQVFFYSPTLGLEPYDDNFDTIGFGSASIIYNLGDLGIIQFYIFVLVLLFLVAKIFKCTERADRYKQALFFNFSLRFIISGYMEISFGSLIKYFSNSYSFVTKSDSADTVIACFYLGLIFVFPPFLILLTNCKTEEIQEQGSFYQKIEEMFELTHLKTQAALNYTTIYLVRRILLILTIFFLAGKYSVFQVVFIVHNSVFYLAYLCSVKPFLMRRDLYIEVITEFCLLTFSYVVMCYSDFVPEATIRSQMGIAGIAVCSLNLFVNMILILFNLMFSFKQGYIKYKQKLQRCCFKQEKVQIQTQNQKEKDPEPLEVQQARPKEIQIKIKKKKQPVQKQKQTKHTKSGKKYKIKHYESSPSSSSSSSQLQDQNDDYDFDKYLTPRQNSDDQVSEIILIDQEESSMPPEIEINFEKEPKKVKKQKDSLKLDKKRTHQPQSNPNDQFSKMNATEFLLTVASEINQEKARFVEIAQKLKVKKVTTLKDLAKISDKQWREVGVTIGIQNHIKSFLPGERPLLIQPEQDYSSKFTYKPAQITQVSFSSHFQPKPYKQASQKSFNSQSSYGNQILYPEAMSQELQDKITQEDSIQQQIDAEFMKQMALQKASQQSKSKRSSHQSLRKVVQVPAKQQPKDDDTSLTKEIKNKMHFAHDSKAQPMRVPSTTYAPEVVQFDYKLPHEIFKPHDEYEFEFI